MFGVIDIFVKNALISCMKNNRVWRDLEAGNFGKVIYTVGDGVDKTTTGKLNALSSANAIKAAELTQATKDAVLFIAGGNGGDKHGRDFQNNLPGSMTEAERMQHHINFEMGLNIPIATDCDPTFKEIFELDPSHNTPQNAANAAAVIDWREGIKTCDITAEEIHCGRVIATLLHELRKREVDLVFLRAHPLNAPFEKTNDQWHIRNKTVFRIWNLVGWAEHFAKGSVDRGEVLREFLTFRNFGKYKEPVSEVAL